MNNQITTFPNHQNYFQQSPEKHQMQPNDSQGSNFNTLLYNSLAQYQNQLHTQNKNDFRLKDSPLKTQSSPSKNQYQYSFGGNDANQNAQLMAYQSNNTNQEGLPNLQQQYSLQSPPYSGDPKNNYLYISSLPGSKYGSQSQIQSAHSQNQLSSHNLQLANQQSHQHPLTISTPRYGSNAAIPSSKQSSQPEIKSYKQMKAIHRESKLMTPTSAFSPEIQKVIEDMKNKQMIQTNESSDFAIHSQAVNSQKSDGNSNLLQVNQESKKDITEQRRLSTVEIYQLKSHQIVQDLNSIQQQVRIDSANVAMKRNTLNTFNNIMSSQNSSQANFNDQHPHKQLIKSKNNSNIQSLTSLDKQNLPTEANRFQKSKYKQYERNSITSGRFNKDRARLKEALLSKNENKNDNPFLTSKMQTISLPDISYGFNSQSEMGSDKKSNSRQVKTKGSLEHLDDIEDNIQDFVIQGSNRSSNQSSPRRKKMQSSLQEQFSDRKSESPQPQVKINGTEVMPIKYTNAVNNLQLKKSLDCVNEVFQDQDSKILPSPQFAKAKDRQEDKEDEKLSSVGTFSSSSENSSGSPVVVSKKKQSSLDMVQKYFPNNNQDKKRESKQQNQVEVDSQEERIEVYPSDKIIEDSKHSDSQHQEKVKKTQMVKENKKDKEQQSPIKKTNLDPNQQQKEKSLQSSIVSLKNNEKLSLPLQNMVSPITISDIQPYSESERKQQSDQQYQMLLKQQNQQLNIAGFSPIRHEDLSNEGNRQNQFFTNNAQKQQGDDLKSSDKKKKQQQQNNRYQGGSKNASSSKNQQQQQQQLRQNNNNMEQISQKLLQNQIMQINKYDKSDKNFAQQAFNSFGSDVDLQQFLTDIQSKQEEEKRILLQNQLIEARLELDTNQRSILNSMNPSPRMAAMNNPSGYLLASPYPMYTKSFGDLVGSDIFALSSDLNVQQNPTNQRRSVQANQTPQQQQYVNNLQERINSRIQSQIPKQQQQQFSPRTAALKQQQLRASYYQKDFQYKGDGKYKSPQRISVKSASGHDISDTEIIEEDLHITNILSDKYVETLDQPDNYQIIYSKKEKADYYQPSYLRATKSFASSVKNIKATKEKQSQVPAQKKFKYK